MRIGVVLEPEFGVSQGLLHFRFKNFNVLLRLRMLLAHFVDVVADLFPYLKY